MKKMVKKILWVATMKIIKKKLLKGFILFLFKTTTSYGQ